MTKTPAVNFLVDTVSDPLEVKKAVRGLRAVVRLGRLAERTLARLEEDGKYPGRAAWLDREKYGRGHVLRYSRFPTMPTVSRSDVPGYGPVRFRLARQRNAGPGTDEFVNPDYLDVLVTGGVPELVLTPKEREQEWRRLGVELPPDGTGEIILGERKIGAVRLTVNGGTLYPESRSHSRARSITLVKNVQSSDAHRVASIIPAVLCGEVAETSPRVAVYCRSMQRWLYEDGHAERFLSELREAAIRYKTVSRVMSD